MTTGTECIVFTSTPEDNHGKAQLNSRYGNEGVYAINLQLLNRTLEECVAAFGTSNVLLAVTGWHTRFSDASKRFKVRLVKQQAGCLGHRMHSALHAALTYRERALLVAVDCPTLTASKLLRAAKTLDGTRMVFVPTEDGGYVLVGATLLSREVFQGMHTGSADSMERARKSLEAIGWQYDKHWVELPREWRIRNPSDAERASKLGALALPMKLAGQR
jgi:glycosyltransferase A (GT-A) superfamily protein (DUF2064 family)